MLKNQLKNIRGSNYFVENYLYQIKVITENLGVINERIPISDLTIYILNGLDRAYNDFFYPCTK